MKTFAANANTRQDPPSGVDGAEEDDPQPWERKAAEIEARVPRLVRRIKKLTRLFPFFTDTRTTQKGGTAAPLPQHHAQQHPAQELAALLSHPVP